MTDLVAMLEVRGVALGGGDAPPYRLALAPPTTASDL